MMRWSEVQHEAYLQECGTRGRECQVCPRCKAVQHAFVVWRTTKGETVYKCRNCGHQWGA